MNNHMNAVQLLGEVADPIELRQTQGGRCVTNVNMRVVTKFRRRDAEAGERTVYVQCVFWGGMAEEVGRVPQGATLWVTGELTVDVWEDRQGNKRSQLRVTARDWGLCGGAGGGQRRAPTAREEPKPPRQVKNAAFADWGGGGEEDIPF